MYADFLEGRGEVISFDIQVGLEEERMIELGRQATACATRAGSSISG